MKKIVLIGHGTVGSSFIYSALNQELAQEYILIDKSKDSSKKHAFNFHDVQASLGNCKVSIKAGDYQDCKDADLIVIAASRITKAEESRLDMTADNAKIIKNIALQVKASGFNGITIIATNPVDIMTTIYQKITGFDVHKILGSGTTIDTLRLKHLLGQKLNVNPNLISTYVLAEHGHSAVIPWSKTTIDNQAIETLLEKEELNRIEKQVKQRAREIINRKNTITYGIGAALTLLVKAMQENQNTIIPASAYLNGEYNNNGLYIGVPVTLNQNGWNEVIELQLTDDEQNKFNNSAQVIKDNLKIAYDALKEEII